MGSGAVAGSPRWRLVPSWPCCLQWKRDFANGPSPMSRPRTASCSGVSASRGAVETQHGSAAFLAYTDGTRPRTKGRTAHKHLNGVTRDSLCLCRSLGTSTFWSRIVESGGLRALDICHSMAAARSRLLLNFYVPTWPEVVRTSNQNSEYPRNSAIRRTLTCHASRRWCTVARRRAGLVAFGG